MRIEEKSGNVYAYELKDFDLAQTMECGQCFHFKCIGDNEYAIVHRDRLLHAKQEGDVLVLFDTTFIDYENVWKEYFDLERDYSDIKAKLLKGDERLKTAMDDMWGVRILNQDFFETLISFIISQNKQIPHIKQLVALLSERYGTYLGEISGEKYYAFPSVEKLRMVTLEELYECKTGFRAPYIYDAVQKVSEGLIEGTSLKNMVYEECLNTLMLIKGVGEKVANCTMLFSLGHRAAFPVDVWIKRIMENMYFEGETKKEVIQSFAKEHFGELGGYAQQYLFYYGRENKLGKK